MKQEKVYYSIREIGEMLSLPLPTLRYWETVIPQLKPVKRNNTTRRYYTAQHIELLKRIKFLREEQNLPIENVNRILKQEKKNIDNLQRATELLHQLREQLVQIRNKI